LVTALGIIGIFVSFTVQKSDVDPIAMMIAFASIAISIVGISLILDTPTTSAPEGKTPVERGTGDLRCHI
jgi:hypothetical protein